MTLYLMTKEKGEVDGDVLFSIADQIKHGIGNLATENHTLRVGFAKLYELSGSKIYEEKYLLPHYFILVN